MVKTAESSPTYLPSFGRCSNVAATLMIKLVSNDVNRVVLLELRGSGECTAKMLATALDRSYPGVNWFYGLVPLADLGTLPSVRDHASEPMLMLSDVPVPSMNRGVNAISARAMKRALTGLVVVEGPDPGGVLELHRGVYSFGRGETDLRISDSLLSRRHALVSVSSTSILLNDEGSANGVWLAGTRIDSCKLMIGDSFTAGRSVFEVVHLSAAGLPETQDSASGNGAWPLVPVPIQGSEPAARLALLLTGVLTPLAMGLGLYLVTHSAFFLAFSALSVFTGGIPAFFTLRSKRAFSRVRMAAEVTDKLRRTEIAPPIGNVAAGLKRTGFVAEDGFPPIVLGLAPLVPWVSSDGKVSPAQMITRADITGSRTLWTRKRSSKEPPDSPENGVHTLLSPVLVRLRAGESMVLEGHTGQWAPMLRAMVLRWLPLLQSDALRIQIIGNADFLPANLLLLAGVEVLELPVRPPDEAHQRTIVVVAPEARMGEPMAAKNDKRVWIYCGRSALQSHPQARIDQHGILQLAEDSWEANPWLRAAGNQCVSTRADSTTGLFLPLHPAALSQAVLETAVEKICTQKQLNFTPRNESAAGVSEGPGRTGQRDSTIISTPATRSDAGMHAVIGDDAQGPVVLNFKTNGPHFLIAGTTGSGKSELLRSLVLGLAQNYGPDELAFMLVDFKGGATLGPLAVLPHVQNFVSDLDAAAARRILEQLTSELHRREKLLAAHAADDHAHYVAGRSENDPFLPILVVVIDEFRVFSTELPGALENIVQLATVGRSLGIHLVLSTQRPSGTLNAQLRANISTTIALRTIGEFESSDLIGSSAAAHLDPSTPGMAFMRCGGETPRKFRARMNARAAVTLELRAWGHALGAPLWKQRLVADQAPVASKPLPLKRRKDLGETMGKSRDCKTHGTELGSMIAQICSRWERTEGPQNPFSPELPKYLSTLPRSLLRHKAPGQIVVGLEDRVDAPHPAPLVFDPHTCCRLAVFGLPGSGIETVPEVLTRAVNQHAWRLAVLVLDGDGTQAQLATIPGVRGYLGPHDGWRMDELLRQLDEASSTGELLLIVSGLAGWAHALGPTTFQHFDAVLGKYARSAALTGSCLVICGDKDLASIRAMALCETRWYFPLGAGPEVLMGWPKLKNVSPAPGRGLMVNPQGLDMGAEFQLLSPHAFGNAPQHLSPVPDRWISNVPLPEVLSGAEFRAQLRPGIHDNSGGYPGDATKDLLGLPIGVCGPDNQIFGWQPGGVGIVIGRSGSGKHLVTDHLAIYGNPTGKKTAFYGIDDVLPRSLNDFGSPTVGLVVIERADARVPEAAQALALLLAAKIPVVISSEPSARLLFDLGLSSVTRDPRCFLVLDPRSVADAEPSELRFASQPRGIRGRGLVFDGGMLRQIQCVNLL